MKRSYNDNDFEKHIRDRLYEFEHDPDQKLKRGVLGNIEKTKGINYRKTSMITVSIAIILLILLTMLWKQEPAQNDIASHSSTSKHTDRAHPDDQLQDVHTPYLSDTKDNHTLPSNRDGKYLSENGEQVKTKSADPIYQPDNDTRGSNERLTSENNNSHSRPDKLSPLSSIKKYNKENSRISTKTSSIEMTRSDSLSRFVGNSQHQSFQKINNIAPELSRIAPIEMLRSIPKLQDQQQSIANNKMAQETSKSPKSKHELITRKNNNPWGIYTNILTYWTFQKATPNKNDDWIVSKMDNYDWISPERLGARFDVGAFLTLSDQFEFYGGISGYFQQYNSKFAIRSSQAESFQRDEASGGLTPVFNKKVVDIHKNIWSIGSKIGVRYYLPQGNKNFWVSPNVDYQYTLSNTSQEQFNIAPNQFYLNVEFGWSKYISKNLLFNISPGFTYSLIRGNAGQSLISLQPYSWGINLGLKYSIRH